MDAHGRSRNSRIDASSDAREEIMDVKLGNPAPLGLFAFASTTWLLSMVNAGWFDDKSVVVVLSMALVFGGTVQAIAGILAFVRGNTFPGVAFMAYGAFWISLVTFIKFLGGDACRLSAGICSSGGFSVSTCGSHHSDIIQRCN